MFMIDDLANTWVDTNRNGVLDLGEDWGYFKDRDNSSFRYLTERILQHFPHLKVTFFVPVGVRAGMIKNALIRTVSKCINADKESKRFFKQIHDHPNYELAYHGTTHGIVGPHAADFIQEWETFQSVDEALSQMGKGVDIYYDAIGQKPRGGKYCGYKGNEYSDDSIDLAGFSWWCRYWNRGHGRGGDKTIAGPDEDPFMNYDIKRFGESAVIDIPSTLDGGLLRGASQNNYPVAKTMKRFLKKSLVRWKLREIDFLLEHKLVISIQEHIAPSRDDGKRQSPNIFDDTDSLLGIFEYLRGKNVWYCTGSELADYVNVRDYLSITQKSEDTFKFNDDLKYSNHNITLSFSELNPFKIILPNHSIIDVTDGVASLPVMKGEYTIVI
jgi:hypothetical protein